MAPGHKPTVQKKKHDKHRDEPVKHSDSGEFSDDQEDEGDYKRGGYHRVFVGERYKDGRYVVLRKLGWGHFSTVWLVRDEEADGAVRAMKVVKSATHYTEAARDEVTLLNAIASRDVADASGCARMTDAFDHVGPHGRHVCMVFERLGDNLLTLIRLYDHRGIPLPVVRALAARMLLALDFLHATCHIIHTDMKPENVMLKYPVRHRADRADDAAPAISARAPPAPVGKLAAAIAAGQALTRNQKKKLKKKLRGKDQRDGSPTEGADDAEGDAGEGAAEGDAGEGAAEGDTGEGGPTQGADASGENGDTGRGATNGPDDGAVAPGGGGAGTPVRRDEGEEGHAQGGEGEVAPARDGEGDPGRRGTPSATTAEPSGDGRTGQGDSSASPSVGKDGADEVPDRKDTAEGAPCADVAGGAEGGTEDAADGTEGGLKDAAERDVAADASASEGEAGPAGEAPQASPPSASPLPEGSEVPRPPSRSAAAAPSSEKDWLDTSALVGPDGKPDFAVLEARLLAMPAKVVDFGNACWTDRHFTDDIQTRQYRAPEVIIGAGYDTSADMWSLGCMIFEMATGDFLFEPKAGRDYSRDEDHLAQMAELLGRFPRQMATSGRHAREYFNREGRLRHIHNLNYWPLEDVLLQKYKFDRAEASALAEFLTPMLSLVPSKRAAAAEMLRHPWLADAAREGEPAIAAPAQPAQSARAPEAHGRADRRDKHRRRSTRSRTRSRTPKRSRSPSPARHAATSSATSARPSSNAASKPRGGAAHRSVSNRDKARAA